MKDRNTHSQHRRQHHHHQHHHRPRTNQNPVNSLQQIGPVVLMIAMWFILMGFSGIGGGQTSNQPYLTYQTRTHKYEQ